MIKFFDRYIQKLGEESDFSLFTLNKNYVKWLSKNVLTKKKIDKIKDEIEIFKLKPKISIIMPVYNVDEKWLDSAINSVIEQFYENWELCIADDASTKSHIKKTLEKFELKDERFKINYLTKNLGIVNASNKALELAEGQYVGFMDNDDILYQDALYEVVKKINERSDVEIIYTDEDKIDEFGNRVEPFFKPDWSPNLLMSCNYITHFTVMKTELVRSLRGFREGFDGSQDYDLLLRAVDNKRVIEHIPKILYGWRKILGSAASSVDAKPYAYISAVKALETKLQRLGLEGSIIPLIKFLPFYRVKPKFGNPRVSIIFYSNVEQNILKFIKYIKKYTYQNFELIIITDLKIKLNQKMLSRYNIKKLLYVDNLSKVSESLNLGAKIADGDFLLFMTDKIRKFNKDWLESLLEQGCLKDVGIVGLLMITKNMTFQPRIFHAGIILGLDGIASNAFMGRPWFNNPDYFGLNLTVRNCSAVSINCLLIKKPVFNQVGGFDENLSDFYLDVDLCLRVEEKGHMIVYTPYAKLFYSNQKRDVLLYEDEQYFKKKWSEQLAKPDPYYNINLSKKNGGYTLDIS
jgi:glycosyltransferase involved in cell wall biosynthesis